MRMDSGGNMRISNFGNQNEMPTRKTPVRSVWTRCVGCNRSSLHTQARVQITTPAPRDPHTFNGSNYSAGTKGPGDMVRRASEVGRGSLIFDVSMGRGS